MNPDPSLHMKHSPNPSAPFHKLSSRPIPRWNRPLSLRHSAALARAVLPALLTGGLATAALPTVRAQMVPPQDVATLSILHNFDPTGESSLVQGRNGNFYGVFSGGYAGSVFEVAPTGLFATLYSFTGGSDGASPQNPLVQGSDGSFYGTTGQGGANSDGTIFRVTPAGVLTTLYSFTGGSDGSGTIGALLQGCDGNFYGANINGGADSDGTIFEISPTGVFTTIHAFNGSDGAAPVTLLLGNDGNFYGATNGNAYLLNGNPTGAKISYGTVFKITPEGVLTTLYSFTGGDGSSANGLVQGRDGNFYGTTGLGGANNQGTVFQLTPAGALTTLHNFNASIDGYFPHGLVQGSNGNFFGMVGVGPLGEGTIFEISPTGAFTTLYSFSGSDGAGPGLLVLGSDGNFYGTTDTGTIFRLSVHPPFFTGEVPLSDGVYYLAFFSGNSFGYYSFLEDAGYVYHFDLGYEYVFDANDGNSGVYLYDFASDDFFYTSPTFPFPFLYDFGLNTVVYYYPDPNNAGRYTTGPRYFYDFATNQVITK